MEPQQKVVLNFVGDIMHTPESIAFLTKMDPLNLAPNYDYIFQHIDCHFRQLKSDILYGNLEMPILPSLPPTMLDIPAGYFFNGHPNLLMSLKKLGFNVLQTSNNHCFDQGEEGMISTIDLLEKNAINYSGTSKIPGEFAQVSNTASGLKVCTLAFTQFLNGEDPYEDICPKVNLIPFQSEEDLIMLEKIKNQIQELQKAHSPDIIVIMVHWGDEYFPIPDEYIRKAGRLLIEYGADVVIGTHPHILQPYEIVDCEERKGIIFYSLGNFTSGWTQKEGNNHSVILSLEFQKKPQVFKISLMPIFEDPETFQLYFAEDVLKEKDKKAINVMAQECIDLMKMRIYQL